jgi:hypothetical protein
MDCLLLAIEYSRVPFSPDVLLCPRVASRQPTIPTRHCSITFPAAGEEMRPFSPAFNRRPTVRKGYSAFNGHVTFLTPMPASSKRLRFDMAGRRPTRTNVSICALRASRARKTQQCAARCGLQKQPAAASRSDKERARPLPVNGPLHFAN